MPMETPECCSSKERSPGPAVQIMSETLQPLPLASGRAGGCFPTLGVGRSDGAGANLIAIFAKKSSYPKQYNIRRDAESRTSKAVRWPRRRNSAIGESTWRQRLLSRKQRQPK
jgi:hypothetical protein